MDNQPFFIEVRTINLGYKGLDNEVFLNGVGQSSFFTEWWTINFFYRGGQSTFFTEGWTIKFFYRGVNNEVFFTEGWTMNFFL